MADTTIRKIAARPAMAGIIHARDGAFFPFSESGKRHRLLSLHGRFKPAQPKKSRPRAALFDISNLPPRMAILITNAQHPQPEGRGIIILAHNLCSSKSVFMKTPADKSDMISLKGKTVLQVIPTLDIGGAERTTVDMVRGLVEAGANALVASAGGRLVEQVVSAGGTHVTLPLNAKFRLDQLWGCKGALKKICRDQKVDLIHARSRAPAFPARAAAKALGLPFITTYHGIYSERSALKKWYNSIMVSGDAVIANSHYTASIIAERYGSQNVHVVHRGTDMEAFDPASIKQEEHDALREAFNVPDGRPVVMLLARLTEWKGHLLALEAARILKNRMAPMPIFVFVGSAQSDTYVERVGEMISDHGLDHDVILPGHSDNPPLALSLADCVIVPSTKPEAFGRSVAEASAMAVTVIAFDHGGATETIACPPDVSEGERTGFRVPLRDVKALADAIEATINLPVEDRASMGARGRAHIAQHFSKAQMVTKTLSIYANHL